MYIVSRLSRKTETTAGDQDNFEARPRHRIKKKGLGCLVTLFRRIRSLLTYLVPLYSKRSKMSSVHHLYRKAAASTLKAAKNWNVNDRGPE